MALTSGIIKRCLEECEKSTYKVRIGAVIFSSKRIISSGHNEIRSSSIPNKHKTYYNSIHAEQDAVFNCKDWSKLKGCSILVLKLSKVTKELSNAKPCTTCLELLRFVGIKTIHYSDQFSDIIQMYRDRVVGKTYC
jgi:deoxycytidylate deaminase